MTEHEHHAWGALLKYIEAVGTTYRYDRYPKTSKTGKTLKRFLDAAKALREQLSHEYSWVATEHLLTKDPLTDNYQVRDNAEDYWEARRAAARSNVYYGDEVDWLNFVVFHEIENAPPKRVLNSLGIDPLAFENRKRELFHGAVKRLVIAAQGPTTKLPWEGPAVLPLAPPTDRRAELREALLENPDQPQAAFVRLCRVHPNTVRRCRRELEEAEDIPFLPHRHGPGQPNQHLAEAADFDQLNLAE
jgi:hypothetical protein